MPIDRVTQEAFLKLEMRVFEETAKPQLKTVLQRALTVQDLIDRLQEQPDKLAPVTLEVTIGEDLSFERVFLLGVDSAIEGYLESRSVCILAGCRPKLVDAFLKELES